MIHRFVLAISAVEHNLHNNICDNVKICAVIIDKLYNNETYDQ